MKALRWYVFSLFFSTMALAEPQYILEGIYRVEPQDVFVEFRMVAEIGDWHQYSDQISLFFKAPNGEWILHDQEKNVRIVQMKYSQVNPAGTRPHYGFSEAAQGLEINSSEESFPAEAKKKAGGKLVFPVAAFDTEVRRLYSLDAPQMAPLSRGVKIIEKGREFILMKTDDGLRISDTTGKSVLIGEFFGEPTIENLRITNGILWVAGPQRKIDLWMFDEEVSFNGDSANPKDFLDPKGDKRTISKRTFDLVYPDMVAQARDSMGSNEVIFESPSETMQQMALVLRNRKSIKLLGPAGSGKSTEVKELAKMIASGKIRGVPRTAELRLFSLGTLSSGTKYSGAIESKVSEILAYAHTYRSVFVADEFHAIQGMGSTEGQMGDVTQYMKPELEEGILQIIGISTEQEWNAAFGKDKALDQRFSEVIHRPLEGEALVAAIEKSFRMKKLPIPEREVIRKAIQLSNEFAISGSQPRLAVNLLSEANIMMDEQSGEMASANVEALQKATSRIYSVDPIYFDKKQILEKLSTLRKGLESQVTGQPEAVDAVVRLWLEKFSGVGSGERASSIIFFGPPGTGKTLTSKLAAQGMNLKSRLVEMNKYANGDVEAFRYEVYLALKESPNSVIILDEIEKAPLSVQNASLQMLQPGEFTVNFRAPGGTKIFETVRSNNAIFAITTNAGQTPSIEVGSSIGFKPIEVKRGTLQGEGVIKKLIEDGVSEPLLSRASYIVGLGRPSQANFKAELVRSLEKTVRRESLKQKIEFRISNKETLINDLVAQYIPGQTDYRDVEKLIKRYVEPLISQAVIESHTNSAESARRVVIEWTSDLMNMAFPTMEHCQSLLMKYNRPLGTLGAKR